MGKSLGLDTKQDALDGETLLSHWWVQGSSLTSTVSRDGSVQATRRPCGWSCALVPALAPSGGLEKKST